MNNIFFDIKYLIISYIFKKETLEYLITNNYNFKPNLHQKTVKAFNEKKYNIFEDLILNGLFDKNTNWFYKDNFIIKLIESDLYENLVYFYIDNYKIDFYRIRNINYLMTALDKNKFKIADFIIKKSQPSQNREGLQWIIETHSEYLITRLRLRTVQDSETSKQYQIVFAENDDVHGTTYRPVDVDENGSLETWPAPLARPAHRPTAPRRPGHSRRARPGWGKSWRLLLYGSNR